MADSSFQLKLAAGIIIVTTVTVSVFIGLIVRSSASNSAKLDVVVENQNIMSRNQNELLKTMHVLSDVKKRDSINISTEMIERDIEENNVRSGKNNALIADISNENRRLVMILIVCVLIQSVLLFIMLIRRTNRLSGPLVLLHRYVKEIKNGTLPDVRSLRPNDDLQELFNDFRLMVKQLKK
jgi:hypothetical protein